MLSSTGTRTRDVLPSQKLARDLKVELKKNGIDGLFNKISALVHGSTSRDLQAILSEILVEHGHVDIRILNTKLVRKRRVSQGVFIGEGLASIIAWDTSGGIVRGESIQSVDSRRYRGKKQSKFRNTVNDIEG